MLPAAFFIHLTEKQELRENNRVYTAMVVIWLMITQRLQGHGTLETGVLEVGGLPASFWPRPCKRLQDPANRVSSNTASYNKARQRLPVTVVEQSLDHVFEQLMAEAAGPVTAGRRAFFLDGTSVRLPHTPALYEAYPPGSNQHGESHWPLLRMVVAHDLYTGLGMRPEWGPFNGPKAAGEQGLLEQAMGRLPSESVVLGDANFGVFSVAYAAAQRGHPVVLRLTAARARRLAGEPLRDGIERRMHWTPTRDDRHSHPELPQQACVAGWLVVRQVQPSDESQPFLLALFSTLEVPVEELYALYGQRWNIETDLRSLKSTLELEQLTCTTPEMVAKEIDVAMLTYNLVRATAWRAAQISGLPPRAFGFTRVRNVIKVYMPLIAAAPNERRAQELIETMMYYVGQAKLPKRRKKRPSYPRAVWPKPQKYPKRKA